MQLHIGALVEEGRDQFRLVRRKVVEDDVDLAPGLARADHLLEEVDELSTGVAPSRLALHLAGFGVERRIERQCAVALVLEAVAFGAAGR